MAPIPKAPYPKAPITEAVIHLRVAGSASGDEQEKLVRRLRKSYPHTDPLHEFAFTIDTSGAAAPAIQQKPQGFRLSSEDRADLILIFPTGLVTARVAPYLGWEHLRDRARAAWSEWRGSTDYRPIDRLGVRYINRIDVPFRGETGLHLASYLNFRPEVPIVGDGPIAGYMVQATIPTKHPLWTAAITSTIVVPPPLINHMSLLLDIDIFRTSDIPGKEDQLWLVMDEARDVKNDVFERCITDQTRELFA